MLNYEYDLQQVEAQKQAASDAINNPSYNTGAWGSITQTSRDMVVIEDFQIGVDNLFLPSPSAQNVNVGYALKTGTFNNKNGVLIEAQIGGENPTNLAFISKGYDTMSNTEFHRQISNLLKGAGETTNQNGKLSTSFNAPAITTFNQTPILVDPQSGQRSSMANTKLATYASDWIYGEELANSSFEGEDGSFELIGEFGDDFLQGNKGNDILWGGFNTAKDPTFSKITYADDGYDMLQGGKGNDTLHGGSGNDFLDGGGLIYDKNNGGKVTGVIDNDGTDILTGGSGNDTFIFNTQSTGVDTITDFTLLIDKIQIGSEFGATSHDQFSFDNTDGGLSFNGEQFATLSNYATLDGFDASRDIQLV